MADINLDKKIFLRDYYPLHKAVEIISSHIKGFDIDDLLHLGATAVIPISYHIPEFNALDAFLEIDEEKHLGAVLGQLNSGEDIEEVRLDSFTSLHYLSRHQVDHGEEFGQFKVQLKSDDYAGLIRAEISGVWDISSWGAEFFERYGEAKTSNLAWLYRSVKTEESSFIAIIAHGDRVVNLSDLVITADTLNGLCGESKKIKVQKLSPSIFDGSHTKEYHAAKREEVLKAAIYMKVNNPELCPNNTKWAEAINDHAHKFWPGGTPPLSTKIISELLGKALSYK